jgi:hypothetical protein
VLSCFLISPVYSPASVYYSSTSCLLSLHVFMACEIFHVLLYFIAGSRRCEELNLLLAGVPSSGRQCCCARTHLSHIITRAHLLLGRRFIALMFVVNGLFPLDLCPALISHCLQTRLKKLFEVRISEELGRHPLCFNNSQS